MSCRTFAQHVQEDGEQNIPRFTVTVGLEFERLD